ncbi:MULTISPECIES: DUF4190 domain-containing protein [unclassified Microbacterium]|uniref:DUF4190 domain-containing protein n=1 Tax=unclassified Microbacterium TaxID=2609290 RepID=UPI000F558D89|nr:DUF4190 domain-containing protein [Microbacterium sp. ABRD28]AZC13630.1 DUF4190 domain-containing protein [Microbacterium sp. ABRD28]
MTDPQNPSAVPPSAPQTPPAYSSAPPPAYNAQPAPGAPVPGKTLGIVAFVLSFFAQLIALILGIVALVQSRKAGVKNGWALAAIIISAVLMVIGIIVIILVAVAVGGGLAAACAELGPGVHNLEGGGTITCS